MGLLGKLRDDGPVNLEFSTSQPGFARHARHPEEQDAQHCGKQTTSPPRSGPQTLGLVHSIYAARLGQIPERVGPCFDKFA